VFSANAAHPASGLLVPIRSAEWQRLLDLVATQSAKGGRGCLGWFLKTNGSWALRSHQQKTGGLAAADQGQAGAGAGCKSETLALPRQGGGWAPACAACKHRLLPRAASGVVDRTASRGHGPAPLISGWPLPLALVPTKAGAQPVARCGTTQARSSNFGQGHGPVPQREDPLAAQASRPGRWPPPEPAFLAQITASTIGWPFVARQLRVRRQGGCGRPAGQTDQAAVVGEPKAGRCGSPGLARSNRKGQATTAPGPHSRGKSAKYPSYLSGHSDLALIAGILAFPGCLPANVLRIQTYSNSPTIRPNPAR